MSDEPKLTIDSIRDALRPPRGDEPRKIVVCHPDRYVEVQKAVTSLGHNDVLVQRNRWVPDPDQVYVIDGEAMRPLLSRRSGSAEDRPEVGGSA